MKIKHTDHRNEENIINNAPNSIDISGRITITVPIKPIIRALIIGFIGTVIVMRPDISIEFGALLIIFSSFLWSVCLIFIKKLTQTDSPITISFYFGIGMIPATFAIAFPVFEMIDLRQFIILVFIAITGTLAQTLMNSALKKGELALLLPFDFLRLIWSVLIGYALFAEEPQITLWIGGFLIIGSTSVSYTHLTLPTKKRV